MLDMGTSSQVFFFGQANPAGVGQGNVPDLLRRVADTIEDAGDIQIEDITFQSEVTEGEDIVELTVYYTPGPRRR